jgi:TolA-binding protein
MSPALKEPSLTDASKLSFPLQLVIMIASALGAVWASQYGLRSDVRDILTRMEATAKIAEIQTKAQEDRMTSLNNDINEMKRRLELQQMQYQQLRETVLEVKRR